MYTIDETYITTWFERDRAHVALRKVELDDIILEFWDDELIALVKDGFLDAKNWHKSMLKYATDCLPVTI